MGRILKYILYLVLLAVGFAIASYFIAKKYEAEVIDAIVFEVNQYLETPVDVEDINFSLLQRFPDASLRFSHVVIPELNKEEPDTLLYIRDLYLQIGLIDFIQKDYKISEAEVNEGFFHMEYLKDGSENFRFWKANEDSIERTVSLKNIELKNFGYSLKTESDILIDAFLHQGNAEGDFGSSKFNLKTDVDLTALAIINRNEALYQSTEINGEIDLTIDNEKNIYAFESEKILLGNEKASLQGKYDSSVNTPFWDVDIAAEQANLQGIIELVPLPNRQLFKNYSPEGKSDIALSLTTKDGFSMNLDFDHLEGDLTHLRSGGKAKVYSSSGTMRLAKNTSELEIYGLQAGIGPGRFTSSGTVSNFEAPKFDLDLEGRLVLSELKDFLDISFAEVLEGKVDLKGNLNGALSRQQLESNKVLEGINLIGEIKLVDGAIKTVGTDHLIQGISGSFEIADNSITTDQLKGRVFDTEFEVAGTLHNALPYLSGQGGKLRIEANLRSDKVHLEQLLQNESQSESQMTLSMPENIGFNLNVYFKELEYKSFAAREITGVAYYQNGLFTLNPIKMELASGELVGNLRVREQEKEFILKCKANLNDMKVNELFVNFDDFGQEVVSSQQVKGAFNGRVDFSTSLDSTLSIRKNSVVSQVEVIIENGKLNRVESIVNIANYIEGNAVWNTFVKTDVLKERLTNIRFETLENQLSIKNGVVTIPEMNISTSVLDLKASGTHDFDNNIDYGIQFRLGELLRTGREKESEFGYVVDDGTGLNLFLNMSGTVEDPQFSMDKANARDARKEKFQTEKKVIKGILKEEFGFFKKDTTLTIPEDDDADEAVIQFEVEFGDSLSISADSTSTDSTSARKKKKKKLSKKDQDLYEELEEDDDI